MVLLLKIALIVLLVVGYVVMLIAAFRATKRDSDSRERIAVALEKLVDK